MSLSALIAGKKNFRFIPQGKRKALWELINKVYQKFAFFGFGERKTSPLRPTFAISKIRRVPLI